MPEEFVLAMNGWTHGYTHYVSVVASYAASKNNVYDTVLLNLAPLENEPLLGCDQHVNLIKFVLYFYLTSQSEM